MSWRAEYLDEAGVVRTTYADTLSLADLREAMMTAIALAERHGTRNFLTDCSALRRGPSIIDLFHLAGDVEARVHTKDFREALVLPTDPATADDIRFWETVCRNRNFVSGTFRTVEEARAWLAAPRSSTHS